MMDVKLILILFASMLLACGPGELETSSSSEPAKDMGSQPDSEEDPWHCGELGLTCIGPLGIGACLEGQCQPTLGGPCLGPEHAPTCDNYCAQLDKACVPLACEGATAWGWVGTQEFTDNACLDANKPLAVGLEIGCAEPLEGLAGTLRCCCEY